MGKLEDIIKMILFIDGTDYNSATYALGEKGKLIMSKKYKVDSRQSHKVLQHLQSFLKANKITSPNPSFARRGIKQIVVNKGPGSFTGTRIGIAHAMALGLAWGVPVKAVSSADYTRMTTRI